MSPSILYQWEEKIASQMPSLNTWQAANLAHFSQGVIRAESCLQRKIALKLPECGQWTSVERRLQRFLANDRLPLYHCFEDWTRWIVSALETLEDLVLLVDETKLSDHVAAMVVGLAYEGRCIPLAWHCYHPNNYPRAGQVGLIVNLLMHIKKGLPDDCCPLVEADRGIGTSPRLCRAIDAMGWRYLFRVTKQSKIVTEQGDYTIYDMVQPGQIWHASGRVFKQRGRIPAYACAIWEPGYDEPWALVTNDADLTGHEYARRNWQEQSFRDLKSHGWQWDHSHVWIPDHTARLLLILTLAYGWILALGTYAFHLGLASRPKKTDAGYVRRYSIFNEGLHYFYRLLKRANPICPKLFFATGKPFP